MQEDDIHILAKGIDVRSLELSFKSYIVLVSLPSLAILASG